MDFAPEPSSAGQALLADASTGRTGRADGAPSGSGPAKEEEEEEERGRGGQSIEDGIAGLHLGEENRPASPPSSSARGGGGTAAGASAAALLPHVAAARFSTGGEVAAGDGVGSSGSMPNGGGGSGGVRPRGLAGCEDALEALREVIGWRVRYQEQGAALGVHWPAGVLLHGPPGCGKTRMVAQVVEECGAALHTVTAATVVGAFVGESERRLRECFEAAAADAASGRVAVVFLDEADALAPRRGPGSGHETRLVAQLLTLVDGAAARPSGSASSPGWNGNGSSSGGVISGHIGGGRAVGCGRAAGVRDSEGGDGGGGGAVVVVAATSRPNSLDPALRRPGRLDREVAVPVPNQQAREAILAVHTASLPLHPAVLLPALAARCSGYTGADLQALCREAAMDAMARALGQREGGSESSGSSRCALPQQPVPPPYTHTHTQPQQQQQQQQPVLASAVATPAAAGGRAGGVVGGGDGGGGGAPPLPAIVEVCWADFEAALLRVGPSVARGAAVEVQPVSWDEIGGLDDVKRRLQQAVEWPVRHAPAFARLGLSPPRGVLLHGPPGCSKTTLARAAAAAARCPMLPLSGAQLYSMYVGDGEALLRERFRQARLAAPSIVFLDEVDALAGKRADAGSGGGAGAGVRLLSALLTEMDGLVLATGVLVLAATNRPEAVDAALMRPGRFDVVLFVPPPDLAGRVEVLRIATRNMPLAPDVDVEALAAATDLFTGAELTGLCREAAMGALREDLHGAVQVASRHFLQARAAMQPLLTQESLARYAAWGVRKGPAPGAPMMTMTMGVS